MEGITYKVSSVEVIIPETIVRANGFHKLAVSDSRKISGNIEIIVVKLVIKIGLILQVAALRTASCKSAVSLF